MKISIENDTLIVCDAHVEHSVKSGNTRGEKQSILVLQEISKIVTEHRPRHIVLGGDFFDAHGVIEAVIAVAAKREIMLWRRLGARIYFVVGNHEYQIVSEEFFGRSMITALFGGMEEDGIFVIDSEASFVKMEEGRFLLGIPYRETWNQFETTCLGPYRAQIAAGVVDLKKDHVTVVWHVGLPFGEKAYRGEECENGWITEDNPVVRELMTEIASDHIVYCGHYHPPSKIPCGDFGHFVYVGAPATRTRSESGQDKRVLFVGPGGRWQGVSTGLALDQVVGTVDEATAHLAKLVDRFGDDVLEIATVHVDLGKEASMADYNIALERAARMAGDINIIPPTQLKRSQVSHLTDRFKSDVAYTKAQMELDVARVATLDHFNNKDFKSISPDSFKAIVSVTPELFRSMARGSPGADLEDVRNRIEAELVEKGFTLASFPELSPEFASQILQAALAWRNLEFIGASV